MDFRAQQLGLLVTSPPCNRRSVRYILIVATIYPWVMQLEFSTHVRGEVPVLFPWTFLSEGKLGREWSVGWIMTPVIAVHLVATTATRPLPPPLCLPDSLHPHLSPQQVLVPTWFSSVQFSCSVVSDSLRPHESQYARPPCPSPTPGVHSDSRPSSQ